MEDQIRHTVTTLQSGWAETRKQSCGIRGIALNVRCCTGRLPSTLSVFSRLSSSLRFFHLGMSSPCRICSYYKCRLNLGLFVCLSVCPSARVTPNRLLPFTLFVYTRSNYLDPHLRCSGSSSGSGLNNCFKEFFMIAR